MSIVTIDLAPSRRPETYVGQAGGLTYAQELEVYKNMLAQNGLAIADVTTASAGGTAGPGRWFALVKKPK